MRGFLASSIGVTCAAALALPGALPASASSAPPAAPAAVPAGAALPGSTQSLPLAPLPADRAAGAAVPQQGLLRRDVRPFSLVGVIWDDPDTELFGRVQVRTRAAGSGRWSGWQDVETHNHEHAADPDTAERASGRVRGATAPLWVGNSNGVEVRVQAEADDRSPGSDESPFPRGLHLELVDPGAAPPTRAPVDAPRASATQFPELSRRQTVAEFLAGQVGHGRLGRGEVRALRTGERSALGDGRDERRVQPYIGPRPRIVTRRGWGADENLRERGFVYTKKVKAAFVHHTASGNNYSCSQAPSVIRSIYRYHVRSSGWRDIGYNFLVDKCGNIYEGRAGGVAKPVMGAHTLGFNSNSMGIAVLGSFGSAKPSGAAVKAVAKLTAWKLGLFGANPRGKTYLKSGGGNLYRKGKNVRLNVISGHRDGFATECPGRRLYTKLGTARSTAARYQGR
ncbi:peptidoglycan recognition protein [Streptomyces sp. NPDC002952]|uniref:peptidoglycan recognition protein family protein n=1 Tax=Streptomyces sp. NPDC002952 TaxID=3364673 RepID=UPI00368EE43A